MPAEICQSASYALAPCDTSFKVRRIEISLLTYMPISLVVGLNTETIRSATRCVLLKPFYFHIQIHGGTAHSPTPCRYYPDNNWIVWLQTIWHEQHTEGEQINTDIVTCHTRKHLYNRELQILSITRSCAVADDHAMLYVTVSHSRSFEMTPLSRASLLVFHCNYVCIFNT